MIVSVQGADLFCSTLGRGPQCIGPICLVPTALGTRPYERQTPTPLADRLKLVFVDLRGAGRSTGEPTDLTFDLLAEDLDAIRAALGVERVAVLGHSILGLLGVEYARRRPESVSHVILVGTPPHGDMARLAAESARFFEEHASEERKQLLRQNLAALPASPSLMQTVLAQTPMRFFDPRLDAAPLFAEVDPRPGLTMHVLRTLAPDWDITAGAESLRSPIFVALGRHDYVVPHTLWDGVADHLPNATLSIFEQSGHQPFFEEPERFAAEVVGWMGGEW